MCRAPAREGSRLAECCGDAIGEQAEGVFVGSGQRMLLTDAGEYPLLDVRSVTLDTAVDTAGEA